MLAEQVVFELSVGRARWDVPDSGGAMEAPAGGVDPERESLDVAESLVYGWPQVDRDPTRVRQEARFVKSFPLKFPMGLGDLYDEERPRKVSGPEWLQHLLNV